MDLKNTKITTKNLLDFAVQKLSDSKIEDIKIFNTTDKSTVAEYFIIGLGTSPRHILATAEKLSDVIQEDCPQNIMISGKNKNTQWVLIDLNGIMVHLFTPEGHEEYNLEELYTKMYC